MLANPATSAKSGEVRLSEAETGGSPLHGSGQRG
jgi:hypothetical protein